MQDIIEEAAIMRAVTLKNLEQSVFPEGLLQLDLIGTN